MRHEGCLYIMLKCRTLRQEAFVTTENCMHRIGSAPGLGLGWRSPGTSASSLLLASGAAPLLASDKPASCQGLVQGVGRIGAILSGLPALCWLQHVGAARNFRERIRADRPLNETTRHLGYVACRDKTLEVITELADTCHDTSQPLLEHNLVWILHCVRVLLMPQAL